MIVVLVLANIGSLTNLQVFALCVSVLMPALVCEWLLLKHVEREGSSKSGYNKVPSSLPLTSLDIAASVPTTPNGTVCTPRRASSP